MASDDERNEPATHDIGVTTEDFRKATHDNVRVWQDLDIAEVAKRLIHHKYKVIFIRERAQTGKVW